MKPEPMDYCETCGSPRHQHPGMVLCTEEPATMNMKEAVRRWMAFDKWASPYWDNAIRTSQYNAFKAGWNAKREEKP